MILYFEKEGLKSTFIGHPISIIDESDYNNNHKKKLIAFLPGSRDNEINKLFPYLEYIYDYLLTNNITDYKIFIPTLPHLIDKLTHLTKDWKIETIISVVLAILILNFVFKKFNILIDQTSISNHKSFINGLKTIPLSGGLVFFLILIF